MKKTIYIATEQEFFLKAPFHYQMAKRKPVLYCSTDYGKAGTKAIELCKHYQHGVSNSEIVTCFYDDAYSVIVRDKKNTLALYAITITEHIVEL